MAYDLIDGYVIAVAEPDGGLALRDVKTRQDVVLTAAGVDRLREHLKGGDARTE